jgi:hypothetical protein
MERCYTRRVPTIKPRYTFTDAGELEAMLDAGQRRWPDVGDRKVILLRLAEEGASALGLAHKQAEAEERVRGIREAFAQIPSLVDLDLLESDQAWR